MLYSIFANLSTATAISEGCVNNPRVKRWRLMWSDRYQSKTWDPRDATRSEKHTGNKISVISKLCVSEIVGNVQLMKIPELVEFNVSSVGGIVAVGVVLLMDEMFVIFNSQIAWKKAHPADKVIM